MAEDGVAVVGADGAFQDGWLATMPEGTFEKDETGKLKQGDLADHKNLASLSKSYLNGQKMLGSSIQPLGDNPTAEAIALYRVKVGCPENFEGYAVEKPEMPAGLVYDDELLQATTKYAHDNHIPKKVYEGFAKLVIDGQIASFKKQVEADTTESDKVITDAEEAMKSAHGAKYDEVIETANRFYDLPGNDEVNKAFKTLMTDKGIDSHPAVMDYMYEAYKMVKEDLLPDGGAGSAAKKETQPGQLNYETVVGDSGR